MLECPIDLRSGEKLMAEEKWRRLSEEERALVLYHNTAHRQRMAALYRQPDDDDG